MYIYNFAYRQLEEGVSDTQTTAGSEAYQSALVFYNSAKLAASQGINGAKAVYEELKKRFPQRKQKRVEAKIWACFDHLPDVGKMVGDILAIVSNYSC